MAKPTAEGYRAIDIRTWERQGVLAEGTRTWYWTDGSSVNVEAQLIRVVLRYELEGKGGKGEQIEDSISFDLTTSNLGRERRWFLCPGCGRRVAILFLQRYFRCNRCHGLSYRSQQQTPRQRALTRIQKNRMKLGGSPSLVDPFPPKPRYMRWATYFRMMEEDKKALSPYLAEMAASYAAQNLVVQKQSRKSLQRTK